MTSTSYGHTLKLKHASLQAIALDLFTYMYKLMLALALVLISIALTWLYIAMYNCTTYYYM